LTERCSGNPDRTFYKTVRPFVSTKRTAQPPSQLDRNGTIIKEEIEIANSLNEYYVNIADDIGFPCDLQIVDLPNDVYVDKCIDKYKNHSSILDIKNYVAGKGEFRFTFNSTNIDNVSKILSKLDVSKSTGYDTLSSKIIKLSSPTIVHFITDIMNDMFVSKTFPKQLKYTEIQPLHKKGSTIEMANYRPVSILTSLSKIFEKEINNQLKILGDRVFIENLSAYRSNYSTQHVILQATEAVKSSLDRRQCSGAVLTDLSKAFDCLPHDLMIAKLNAYNVNKNDVELIASYLRGRQQRVKIGNQRSNWSYLKKGVPQGSILGPVLFNFFLNDLLLPTSEHTIVNYADDTTIVASSPTMDLLLDKLSSATDTVLKWFAYNGMKANPSKFEFIVFGQNTNRVSLSIRNTPEDEFHINSCDDVKLLGVTLDSKLDFNKHISGICRKSAWQLCALRRLSKYLSSEAKMYIFRSYIASNLDYCKIIWHFCSKKIKIKT
jgi:retron-type reverse transcriptase